MIKEKTKSNSSFVKISFTEGAFAQVFSSIAAPGSIFITKFAIMIGAGPLYFGLLTAIGQLSQLFQPLGFLITRKQTYRKKILVNLLLYSRFLTLFFGFLPFLFKDDLSKILFAFLFFTVTAVQATAGNIWISWIADFVPERVRGRFFSKRTQFLMLTALMTGFVFSFIFDLFESQGKLYEFIRQSGSTFSSLFTKNNTIYAFAAAFSVAAISGVLSAIILSRQKERPRKPSEENFKDSVYSPFRDVNFIKLLIFATWFTLAVGVGSPFWAPFMIQKLKMNLFLIQVYGTVSVVSSIISLRYWGSFIDRFGNKTTMRMTIVLGGLNPMLWIFLKESNFWLVYIEAISSGIMWSATNIIFTNFVLSIAPKDRTQVYSGFFGAFTALGIVVSSLLSGIFMPPAFKSSHFYLEPEQILFALTGILRLTSEIPLSWVHETKSRPLGFALMYMMTSVKMRIINRALLLRGIVVKK
ncbi:MFS transporter [candidate division WOR-3 bacterium]|nr:MFS transporter [candidate division WOR-3 bacterium]